MAESASAFFAKKKKGKKPVKSFNANKLDTPVVTPGAQAESLPTSGAPSASAGTVDQLDTSNDDWEDATPLQSKKTSIAVQSTASELLDMRALHQKRREQDDVAERLRIEETKAVLQKAKDGMEREAKRLEEAKAEKEKAVSVVASRFAAPAANLGLGGGVSSLSSGGVGTWVPAHKRLGAAASASGVSASFGRMGMGDSSKSAFPRKIDVQDEEAFPDLASADKILEAKEKAQNRPAYTLPVKKSTTSAGKSPWGGSVAAAPVSEPIPEQERAPPTLEKEPEREEKIPEQIPAPVEESVTQAEPKQDLASAPVAQVPTPADATTQAPVPEKLATDEGATAIRKKKKKKDLSSFKVSG